MVGHFGPVRRAIGEVIGQHHCGATDALHYDGHVARASAHRFQLVDNVQALVALA